MNEIINNLNDNKFTPTHTQVHLKKTLLLLLKLVKDKIKRTTFYCNLKNYSLTVAGESQYYASASHAIGGASSMMTRSATTHETTSRCLVSSSAQESSFSGFRQGSKTGTSTISSKFQQDHAATSSVSTAAREE